MACEVDDLENDIENLKGTVRKSFALIYATLKARELKTLRQLDAILKQCQSNIELQRSCVKNIHISYENESTLLNNINNFAVIDLERLNFDSNTFAVEDYICPDDDHMYSYKCIEDLTVEDKDLSAIEEAALIQITSTDDCVCYVKINSEDVSRQFREERLPTVENPCDSSVCFVKTVEEPSPDDSVEANDNKSDYSDPDVKKIEPTEEWLNSIKNQTETEPTQTNEQMEHSTITCK